MMVKVIDNNGQYKITIPKELAEAKGWKAGTRLRFVEDTGGNVIIRETGSPGKAGKIERAPGKKEA